MTGTSSADFTVNGAFNAIGNTNLLTGGDALAVGASGQVTVSLTVTPGANLGPYDNSVTASATSPAGVGVTTCGRTPSGLIVDGEPE